MASRLEVKCIRNQDLNDLKSLWRCLEQSSSPSFFQTWTWIGSWLSALPEDLYPILVTLSVDGRIAAAALLGRSKRRRHGLISTRQIHLSETGHVAFDTLTPEYNGILIDSSVADEVTEIFLKELCVLKWDEFVLSGVTASFVNNKARLLQNLGLRLRITGDLEAPYVDLKDLRTRNIDYLDSISANTRYQIRKAIRIYEAGGDLQVNVAESADQAREYLDLLIQMHQQYWEAKAKPGAFGTEFARRFHSNLLSSAWKDGRVQVLRIGTASKDIGFLYNFLHKGRVYNYQSAFLYEDNQKLKPGLVCHYKAIELNSHLGHDDYDFLAGRDRYKRSLAKSSNRLLWVVLQRDRWVFRLEQFARNLKQRILPNEG